MFILAHYYNISYQNYTDTTKCFWHKGAHSTKMSACWKQFSHFVFKPCSGLDLIESAYVWVVELFALWLVCLFPPFYPIQADFQNGSNDSHSLAHQRSDQPNSRLSCDFLSAFCILSLKLYPQVSLLD